MIEPGIHKGLGAGAYHRMGPKPHVDPANAVVSKSLLWRFFPNPAKWRKLPPFIPTRAMQWGTMVDLLALTPNEFGEVFYPAEFPTGRHEIIVDALLADKPLAVSPYDSFRSKESKQWKEEAEAEGKIVVKESELPLAKQHAAVLEKDLIVISPKDVQQASVAAGELLAHPVVGPLIEKAEPQVAVVAKFVEPVTGIELTAKCLLDMTIFEDRRIIDLKTTSIPIFRRKPLENHCFEFGYHVQLAWYASLLEAVTGEKWEKYALVFQENKYPYYVSPPIDVNPDAINLGRRWIASALQRWCECAVQGDWEAYDPGSTIGSIDAPHWAYRDSLEELTA